MYKIRKARNGLGYQFSGWPVCFFTCFVTVWISLLVTVMLQAIGIIKLGGEINKSIGVWVIFFIQLIVMCILGFIDIKMIKIYFSKNLKKNGKGTIKKIKISAIEEMNRHSKGIRARGDSFNGYCLQAEHGNVIYCSDGIEKDDVQEVSISNDVSKIYRDFGYEYDKDETHKKEVLKEINKDIVELEHKMKDGGFLKKMSAKKELFTLKKDKRLVEMGYQPSYIVINGHRITVGDTVDVYVDPDDEKIYWMDIDFLFDK